MVFAKNFFNCAVGVCCGTARSSICINDRFVDSPPATLHFDCVSTLKVRPLCVGVVLPCKRRGKKNGPALGLLVLLWILLSIKEREGGGNCDWGWSSTKNWFLVWWPKWLCLWLPSLRLCFGMKIFCPILKSEVSIVFYVAGYFE